MSDDIRPTLVADLVLPVGGQLRPLRAFLSSALITGISAALLLSLGLVETGVFAVFLTATALAAPLGDLMEANREAIWSGSVNPWTANARTVVGFFGIFGGMVLAFAAIAVWLGQDQLSRAFGFAVRGLSGDLLSREFSDWQSHLMRNLTVTTGLFVIALAFRAYGALLVLGWNVASWVGILSLLIFRGAHVTGLTLPSYYAGAVLAVLPHLLLEGLAYSIASLSAIFLSRGLIRYAPSDLRFWRVSRAASVLIVVALLVLVSAALVEGFWAPWVLGNLH